MELKLSKSIVTSRRVGYTEPATLDDKGELASPVTLSIPKTVWFDLGKPERLTVTVKEDQ